MLGEDSDVMVGEELLVPVSVSLDVGNGLRRVVLLLAALRNFTGHLLTCAEVSRVFGEAYGTSACYVVIRPEVEIIAAPGFWLLFRHG
jgi:hypothetical protein